MELKLKPCPFCSGKGRVRNSKMDTESYARSAVHHLTMRSFSRSMTINLLLNVKLQKRGTRVIEKIQQYFHSSANTLLWEKSTNILYRILTSNSISYLKKDKIKFCKGGKRSHGKISD